MLYVPDEPMVISLNELQLPKEDVCTLDTLPKYTDERLVQPSKALAPIFADPAMVTVLSDVQFANERLPIFAPAPPSSSIDTMFLLSAYAASATVLLSLVKVYEVPSSLIPASETELSKKVTPVKMIDALIRIHPVFFKNHFFTIASTLNPKFIDSSVVI